MPTRAGVRFGQLPRTSWKTCAVASVTPGSPYPKRDLKPAGRHYPLPQSQRVVEAHDAPIPEWFELAHPAAQHTCPYRVAPSVEGVEPKLGTCAWTHGRRTLDERAARRQFDHRHHHPGPQEPCDGEPEAPGGAPAGPSALETRQ